MKRLSILFINLLFISASYACSCWGPAFCETVHSDHGWLNEGYHVLAEKVRTVEHGMEIKILKNYGQNIDSEVIRVWGDLGWLCREYTGIFEEGEMMILNLTKIGNNPVVDIEQPADFQLSFCGVHYLRVRDGVVWGGIFGYEEESISLNDFEFDVMENSSCESTFVDPPPALDEIDVYPNPFTENTTMESEQDISEIELYDASGRRICEFTDIHKQRFYLSSGSVTESGIYFARVILQDRSSRVVQLVKSPY